MKKPVRTREWLLLLFFAGLLAFDPPFLTIFSADAFVLGVPVLFVYIFAAWLLVILCVLVTSETKWPGGPDDGPG